MSAVIPFALVGASLLFMCWMWDSQDLGSAVVSAAAAIVAAAAMILIMLGWLIW